MAQDTIISCLDNCDSLLTGLQSVVLSAALGIVSKHFKMSIPCLKLFFIFPLPLG